MKVLHICNDFMGSKVHENLYKNLSEQNVETLKQSVFFPLRSTTVEKFQKYEQTFDATIIPSKPLKTFHRIFFRKKIDFLYKYLKKNITPEAIDLVHATTLFSDGAIALKLKKEFNIPYIVAVRSTDIEGYFKYRPDLVLLGKEILKEAEKIVFISSTLEKNFLNHPYVKKQKQQLITKCLVINNGIDDFWLKNLSRQKPIKLPAKILYVGSLVKRKNIIKLIAAVLELNKSNVNCNLTIVGDGGPYQEEVEKLSKANGDKINYLGRITSKAKLKEIYNQHHIFALPSVVETFGLVYLEALSQGLPTLYMKNQGIDGLFDFKIGEKCESDEADVIGQKIKQIIDNYKDYQPNQIDFSRFSWEGIARNYLDLYQQHIQ